MNEYLETQSGTSEIETAREALRDFIDSTCESAQRNTRAYGGVLAALTPDEKEQLYNRLTTYVEFMLLQDERLYGLPVRVSGEGLFYKFDSEGALVGTQVIDPEDYITGDIDDAIAQPVPVLDSVHNPLPDGSVVFTDQVASPLLVLKQAKFVTPGADEYSFDECRIGIPLYYPLTVEPDETR